MTLNKIKGQNYGFWSKLNHIISFGLYGYWNDDTINAYNYFVHRHNNKIKQKQVKILKYARLEKT